MLDVDGAGQHGSFGQIGPCKPGARADVSAPSRDARRVGFSGAAGHTNRPVPNRMRPPLDEARLRQIYGETIDALYAYVSRRCGVREAAEDVTQETWLRAVRHWTRNGAPDNPLAWLTTVSRNLMLNQARRPEPLDLDTVSAAEVLAAVEQDDLDDSAEIASIVTKALERLPSEEAKLLKTFHYDRIKVAEIARDYGISERAVEGRLRRARQRLRQELEITLKAEGGLA